MKDMNDLTKENKNVIHSNLCRVGKPHQNVVSK